jgi:osmotically-inducible protein OsmY
MKVKTPAQKKAGETVREARTEARRRMIHARVAAARWRAGSRAKGSHVSAKAIGAAGAAGFAAGYFLDPDSGRRRRHRARDRARSVIRHGAASTRHQLSYRIGRLEGKIEAAWSRTAPGKPAPSDQDLADRVKSEIFQPADAPKGSVNVNVEHGIVYLRGEVKRQEQIRKLIEQAGSVHGVAGVENLLHTP